MTLGIDARSLGSSVHRTGIGVYTHRMIDALIRAASQQPTEMAIQLLFTGRTRVSADEFANHTHHIRMPNKLLNLLWLLSLGPRWPSRVRASYVWYPNTGIINFSSKIPYAVTVHDISFMHHSRYFTPKSRAWHAFSRFTKLLQRADKLIAVSEYTKQDLLRHLPFTRSKKIIVCSPAVTPPSAKTVAPPMAAPYILYVGSLDKRKNIEAVIKSFLLLKTTHPRYELVLVGPSGSYRRSYIERISQEDAIRVKGYVSAVELASLYRGAALFVWPSFYEGFGFPPLEARAHGVPVITSYRTALPEMLQADALYVNPYNVGELTSVMRTVLDNEPEVGESDQENTSARVNTPFRAAPSSATEPEKKRTWDDAARELLTFLVSP